MTNIFWKLNESFDNPNLFRPNLLTLIENIFIFKSASASWDYFKQHDVQWSF